MFCFTHPGVRVCDVDPRHWGAVRSQCRDLAENDNMTPAMKVAQARRLMEWAQDRAQNPSFAPMAFVAAARAQRVMQDHRLRPVR